MSRPNQSAAEELLALRREFDLGFARAVQQRGMVPQHFLALRLGADGYAIRVTDIAGLHLDRRIMPIPSPAPALLGVTGLRGLIAPVYDLAALLGYRTKTTPRWTAVLRGVGLESASEPLMIAFDNFEAHFSAAAASIFAAAQLPGTAPEQIRRHLCDAVQTDTGLRPIISLPSLLTQLRSPSSHATHHPHHLHGSKSS